MVFMTLKTIVFKNKKNNFAFLFFFVSLSSSLVVYRSCLRILSSKEAEGVQNLMLRHWFFAKKVK